MDKVVSCLTTLLCACSLLFLQGCASSHKQFTKNDTFKGPIEVCRFETPGIMKSTSAETGILAAATLAAPGGAALFLLGDVYGKARASGTREKVPDFGSLVSDKFAGRIKESKPDWPALIVADAPVSEEPSGRDTFIVFKVDRLAYGSLDLTRGGIILDKGLGSGIICDGLLSKTTLTMKDQGGEVLWQKSCIYLSKDYDRQKSLGELEADDFRLLKEELEFAAEKTALCFVDDLSEQPSPEQHLLSGETGDGVSSSFFPRQ